MQQLSHYEIDCEAALLLLLLLLSHLSNVTAAARYFAFKCTSAIFVPAVHYHPPLTEVTHSTNHAARYVFTLCKVPLQLL